MKKLTTKKINRKSKIENITLSISEIAKQVERIHVVAATDTIVLSIESKDFLVEIKKNITSILKLASIDSIRLLEKCPDLALWDGKKKDMYLTVKTQSLKTGRK